MGTNIAKRMVFGAVLVCVMLTIVACGSTKEKSDLILGNWTEEKSGIWICFRADGFAEMGLGVGENLAEENLYWSIQGDEIHFSDSYSVLVWHIDTLTEHKLVVRQTRNGKTTVMTYIKE